MDKMNKKELKQLRDEWTASYHGQNEPEVTHVSFFGSMDGKLPPVMKISSNGEIHIKGELADTNEEVTEALTSLVHGYKVPTSRIRVRALQPFGYYDNHEVGEIVNISLVDANKLIKEGYVEIVVTAEGTNM